MKYKAFEDFYKESAIKHLVLAEYQGSLVSPPFSTELCKDYNKLLIWNKESTYIDLDIPIATSKFNGVEIVGDSLWMIPYGIWDEFNTAVELKNKTPIIHTLPNKGKGQYYSLASHNNIGFSFPLGYSDTDYCIKIEDNKIHQIEFPCPKKAHMGTTYCNSGFWSPPRSDEPGYTTVVGYRNNEFVKINIDVSKNTTRKYSDFIAKGNILYSLPFGENKGLLDILEFNTDTFEYHLHKLEILDFSKKYNTGILIKDSIIALPYGDEHENNSYFGLVFNTITKEYKTFDIGLGFGGKYRFRAGIEFDQNAVFFPTGTPSCPIIIVDEMGNIKKKIFLEKYLLGRPIRYQKKLATMAYEIDTGLHYILFLDKNFNLEFVSV